MDWRQKVTGLKARLSCRSTPAVDRVDESRKRDAQQSTPSTATLTTNNETVTPPTYSESCEASTPSYSHFYNGTRFTATHSR
ncbi:transcription factor domain-containing protein [Aspergillus tubingensis]|uniref:transcription factor domain-containing protein n=1 Tax=Aspergillus tubingensis TaxID=5068 RepID=UPI0015785D23|nr:fungal-specific transcription factor domain-domain-containing protein [Aspergillus tubingensis]GFN13961.1 fungal-specific transcription factor domain-domain-containing protein [Aspergillus tubingensis]